MAAIIVGRGTLRAIKASRVWAKVNPPRSMAGRMAWAIEASRRTSLRWVRCIRKVLPPDGTGHGSAIVSSSWRQPHTKAGIGILLTIFGRDFSLTGSLQFQGRHATNIDGLDFSQRWAT